MSALIIFISHAEQGPIRDRLSKELGDGAALRVHERLMVHTRSITQDFPGEKFLYYADYPNWNDAWDFNTYRKRVQQGPDTATRMWAAFEAVFEDGHNGALMIGSDCYELTADILRQGADALSTHDVVIGPSHDGDCYLLGMRGLHPAAIASMPWGTSGLQTQMRYVLEEMGLTWHELPVLRRIHSVEDLAGSGLTYE